MFFVSPVESAGSDRHTSGGRQSHPARQHRAGESCRGANLPATVENPQRLRPAERPGPTRLPTTGTVTNIMLNINYINNIKRRLRRERKEMSLLNCICNDGHSEQADGLIKTMKMMIAVSCWINLTE